MKRGAMLAVVMLCASAQTARDGYRAAYRAWRQADPNLERERRHARG